MKRTDLLAALSALALLAAATAASSPAKAQLRLPRLPVILPLGGNKPPPPAQPGMPGAATQPALVAAAGSDTVYFQPRSTSLDTAAMATLAAQARWLLANPAARVRLEGHGDSSDTRDYALAIGERRAASVRDFLVAQGVLPQRITMLTWGKERPGTIRVGQTMVATGARVVTIVE